MRSSVILICLTMLIAALVPGTAPALSPPHNTDDPSWSMTCIRCHYTPIGPPPAWVNLPTTTDKTFLNNLCTDCHAPGKLSGNAYEEVKTHSAQTTSSAYWGGRWSIECRVCHNPHYQQQALNYPAEPSVNILTGTSTSIASAPGAAASSLSDASRTFVPDQYTGYLLVPNTAYPAQIYRIVSNTNTTLTVHGAINLNYTAAGKVYAIRYGKLLNDRIETPNSGTYQVKFFNKSGPGSFGTSTSAAAMTSICQVCHSQTTSFNNSGVLEGPGHPSAKAGTDCTDCHQHKDGFMASCGACHGYPPVVAAPGGPDGLANNDGGTGSSSPGAHGRHAVSLAYPCGTCHTGGMPASPVYDKKVQIGFTLLGGAYQGGAYDGRTSLANGYTYTVGAPGTTVTNGGTKACSNVYCHGSTMAPNAGTDTTPVWDNPSTAACGTCHGATAARPPGRGSHLKHAQTYLSGYNYACGLCHQDPNADASVHVNGRSEVVFSSHPMTTGGAYSGTPAMLDAYGTCTNIYCHSTIQSSPPGAAPMYRTTPAWGANNTLGCGSCHEYAPILASGSHGKHWQMPELQECWPCHNYNNTDDPCLACHDSNTIEVQRDKHANYGINVAFAPRYGGSYSGTPQPGDGYGSCTNVYCHGATLSGGTNTTPVWGGTAVCGDCHYVSYPISVATPPSGRSHMRHAGTLVRQQGMVCSDCHGANGAGGAGHVDVKVEWALNTAKAGAGALYRGAVSGAVNNPAPSATYGQCSNVYCHSTVQPDGGTGAPDQYFTPTWGDAAVSTCEACHKAAYGDNHSSYNTIASGNHLKHLSYAFTTDPSRICTICHVWNASAMLADSCTFLCHARTSSMHANGNVDVAFIRDFNTSGTATYSGTPAPGDGYGSCSNTDCHSSVQGNPDPVLPPTSATAMWGQTFTGVCGMGACHPVGNAHQGDAGYAPLTTGSHGKHLSYKFDQDGNCQSCHYDPSYGVCTNCHSRTVNHVNKSIDVSFNPAFPTAAGGASGSYSGDTVPRTAYGSCSALYCHSPGTAGSPPYSAPNATLYLWGGTLPSDCTGCHAGDRYAARAMSTGSHGRHLSSYPYDCSVCHITTVSDSRTISLAIYFGNQTLGYRNHANGWTNVAFSAGTASAGTYAGQASPVNLKVPGSAYGACGNTYCHSTGTSLATGIVPTNTTTSWGAAGPLPCNACHGSEAGNDGTGLPWYANGVPKANSHRSASHVDGKCSDCHYATTTNGTTITDRTRHANGVYDVTPNTANGISFTYSFSSGGGTCSTVSCHAGGMTQTWGQEFPAARDHSVPSAGSASRWSFPPCNPLDSHLDSARIALSHDHFCRSLSSAGWLPHCRHRRGTVRLLLQHLCAQDGKDARQRAAGHDLRAPGFHDDRSGRLQPLRGDHLGAADPAPRRGGDQPAGYGGAEGHQLLPAPYGPRQRLHRHAPL